MSKSRLFRLCGCQTQVNGQLLPAAGQVRGALPRHRSVARWSAADRIRGTRARPDEHRRRPLVRYLSSLLVYTVESVIQRQAFQLKFNIGLLP